MVFSLSRLCACSDSEINEIFLVFLHFSASGHTSAVEAVRFGHQEEIIVSGTRSGALKVWNLEAAKMMRVLTGHKVDAEWESDVALWSRITKNTD